MSSARTDRFDEPTGDGDRGRPAADLGHPAASRGRPAPGDGRPRTEPVLALVALAAAALAQLMTNADSLWVLLDLAAALAAVSAVGMLLRTLGVDRQRPAFAELATGVVIGGISVAVLLLATHGPQARVGTLLLDVASAMGALLTALIVGGALSRLRRDGLGSAGTGSGVDDGVGVVGPVGRVAGLVTVLAAVVAAACALRDAALR